MEIHQSTEGKDSEFFSGSKPNDEKGNSVKTSASIKGSINQETDTLPGFATQDENSQCTLHSNIQKLQTKFKGNIPGKSYRNSSDEVSLENKMSSLPKMDKVIIDETVYKSKDNHSRIFLSVISDENDSDEKVYFAQVCRPVFYDDFSEDRENSNITTRPTVYLEPPTTESEKPLDNFIKRVTVEIPSEAKNSSSGIPSLVIPDESVSLTETNSALASSFEVSHETGLQMKFRSLQISNPVKLDETAPKTHMNLNALSSHTIHGETASDISPFSFTGSSFHKYDSRNTGSLSSKEKKQPFKQREKSTRTKREERKVYRKQRYQLPPKDHRRKAYDFNVFSQDQTGDKQFEWKLNLFQLSGTKISEEIVSDTNDSLGEISRPMDYDENVSKSKQKLPDIFKFGASDKTRLGSKFSSFPKSRYVSSDKAASDINSDLLNVSRPITFGYDDSSNSISRQKTLRCINSILRRDSSQESQWLFNTQETSEMKNTRKRKREHRNYHSVSRSKTLEFQVKCEDKSTQTRKTLVADENASKRASFPLGKNCFGDVDEETLRSIRTLLSDCLSCLSNKSETNLGSKNATNQRKDSRNVKRSKVPVESSSKIHKNEERNNATNQSKPPPEFSMRIHQIEKSMDASNQKNKLRNLILSKSVSKYSPRIHQKDDSNFSTNKMPTAVKSKQKAKSLQSGGDSDNIDSSKLKANLPHSHDDYIGHNQNSRSLSKNSSFNRTISFIDRNTRSRPNTSDQHQSIFFELDGRYIEILVSKKTSKTKTTENKSSNSNAANTREINQSQSWTDASKTENRDNLDQLKSSFSKEGRSDIHGTETFIPKTPFKTKISENESSNINAEITREINLSQTSFKAEDSDKINRCHLDPIKGSNEKSNNNRPESNSSKVNTNDDHGFEIKTSCLPLSNNMNLGETPTENTNLLPVSKLMISSESGSEMVLPITGTLIFENSSRNSETVPSDGTEVLTKRPENSTKNRRQKKCTVGNSHQLSLQPKDRLKAYNFKPFSQTYTESTPLKWKFSPLQITGSTISDASDSTIKEDLDQISIPTVPEETTSDINYSLFQTSSSAVLDETSSENNENLTYKFFSRNTEGLSSDGNELLFKLPEKSSRNRRHQLSVAPKDCQSKVHDFQPFSRTYSGNTPFKWELGSFQVSGSTIQEETTSDIKESMNQICKSTVPEETVLSIKDGLAQVSNPTVPEEATSDIKGSLRQMSSFTVLDETASENNETLNNKNCARNIKCQSSDETELSFKLSEKSTKNRKMGQRNAARKQRYQFCEPPKDGQNNGYDFKPFSQTNTKNIEFEWKISSFQTSDSTITGKTTSPSIKDCFGHISSSTAQKETASDIKDNLDQVYGSTVFAQISRSTFPEETPSDIKSQTSSSTALNENAQERNENLTNESKPEKSDHKLENNFSQLHIASSVNPDEPASGRNSGLPSLFRPELSEGEDSFNSVLPLNIAAYRVMNRNMSQSNSNKIDSNKTNNDSPSDWWTLFSIDIDESCEICDVVIAMFLQFLVFIATEYVFEFFNFFFFLIIIFIAAAGI